MTHKARPLARELVIKHEGKRLYPYYDTAVPPRITIGYGRNLDGKGITSAEADYLLENDLDQVFDDLSDYPWWEGLNSVRQAALASMRFNLGSGGFRKFRLMRAALELGDFHRAGNEALNSKWATQVGKRALDIAAQISNGEQT